jgi:sulfur-oxidizing protein SoxY
MTLVAEPVYGELEVKSNPPGAKWYLDGDYMGTTPDRATQIRPGTHVVRIEKAGFDAQEYRQNIVTGPNATLAASLRPAASVAVAVPAAPPPVAYSPTTPVDARDVINKLSSGIQRYLSSDLSLKAPDVAENGAVVPLEGLVYSNLPGSMFIFVDNGGQMVFAGSLEFKVPVSRYFFSTRVRMPNSGDLTVAFVDAAGNIKAANKRIKVTIGGKLESGGGVALPGGDKSIRMRESGGTVKMLVASPVTVNAHVESFRVEGDGRLLAVGGFTPWLSKNPYFSFPIPNGVGQLNIGMVGNDRSTANVAVRTTVANR